MTTSLDMIPGDYREGMRRMRHVKAAVVLSALVMMAAVGGSLALNKAARAVVKQTADIRTLHALSAQQREQLDVLDQRMSALDQELTLLRGLRSGASAEDLFLIVDRALPGGDVWFVDWEFRRAGVIVPRNPRTVSTGYFIVVSDSENPDEHAMWQVKTHMKINGQSLDHAALSRFVRSLFEQPEVQDVKLNRTQVRKYTNTSVVDFDLAIVLYSEPAAGA